MARAQECLSWASARLATLTSRLPRGIPMSTFWQRMKAHFAETRRRRVLRTLGLYIVARKKGTGDINSAPGVKSRPDGLG